MKHTPLALIILDGFGHRQACEYNAICQAHTPNWDAWWQHYPHTLISGSGCDVGLPKGQMGNSEVGHMNFGAGRVIYQELTRIHRDIDNGDFFKNAVLRQAFEKAKSKNSKVHLLGLLSPGGVHSHESHLWALLQLAKQMDCASVYVHAFLDGRDTPPKSAAASLVALEQRMHALKVGQIASIIGRYYAMDRDKRFDRIEKAFRLLTEGVAEYKFPNSQSALEAAYARGETDEFVQPTLIQSTAHWQGQIEDDDVVIFFNFRADRARQLSQAFVWPNFAGFTRHRIPKLSAFVTMTEYAADIPSQVVFTQENLSNMFGEWIAKHGLSQLRIAETEKYAHVTFFFNGGLEAPFPLETRILVPSPKVATYDLKPEMSAFELTDQLVAAIVAKQFDVIIVNYANADMVGHTGNLEAAKKAIEALDVCLGKVIAALQQVGGEAIITADHGNAERMYDPTTQQAHTAHTSELVPFLYIGRPAQWIADKGILADVAPTLLHLLDLPVPPEMTGKALCKVS